MTNLNFTLYDFFVDVIPGVIGLVLVVPLLPGPFDFGLMLGDGFTAGLVLLIAGYVVGHFIQSVASWVDSTLRLRVVSALGRKDDILTIQYPFEDELARLGDESPVATGFRDLVDVYFDSGLSDTELFGVIQSYLWTKDIGRIRRFQALYTFFRSLWVLLLVVTVIYTAATIVTVVGLYSAVLTPLQLGVSAILLFAGCIGAYTRRVRFHKEMARSMIYDFYTHGRHETVFNK